MLVYLGSTLIGSFDTIGTYTYYGFATVLGVGYPLILTPEVDGVECCISTVSSFDILTNFIVGIYSGSNTYITQFSYVSNPEYFTFSKNSVTINIDWSEFILEYGCYYLCIADPCINTGGQNYPPTITNGTFTGNANGWTYGSKWSYSANSISGTVTGGLSKKSDYELYQTNVFNSYTNKYCISFDCTAGSGTVKVYFGETLVATEIITSGNTYEVCGIPYGNGNLMFVVSDGTFTLDNVESIDIEPSGYTCNMTSNMFKLDDYSNTCTLLVNACNNEDGLGFVFDGSGFSPRLRLNAKLKEPKYPNERLSYTDSKGKKQVYWFNGRKQKSFCTDLEPEYVLNYLWTLFGYDNVYINNELYTVDDDEFVPTYSFDNVGSVRFLVSKKTQSVVNKNCSDTENNCIINENYLLQADDNSVFVVQTNGDYLLIN
jgi:hypothetical protein